MTTPKFTLLNTRPRHQAAHLDGLIKSIGGRALSCPTIEIDWLQPANLSALETADSLIFISRNAVEGLLKQVSAESIANKSIYAIGQATQKALVSFGLKVVFYDDSLQDDPLNQEVFLQYDSETLLRQLNQSTRQTVSEKFGLVKGEGGRETIYNALTQQGHPVYKLDVYRRQPARFCKSAWEMFRKSEWRIVLATSQTSLQNLVAMQKTEANKDWLKRQPLIVFSQRISQYAERIGWQAPVICVQTQSDVGILEAVKSFLK